jgi:hypothetical protein
LEDLALIRTIVNFEAFSFLLLLLLLDLRLLAESQQGQLNRTQAI